MATTTTTTTLSTPKVRDGFKKDGTVLITKRGYIMWLKARHEENPHSYIFTISRYSATECPIGQYCKAMGISVFKAPKLAEKVRRFYDEKYHGTMYSAIDAVYHMVALYGYRYSAIFYGDEEDYNESGKLYK
jgi:hypothetical protein